MADSLVREGKVSYAKPIHRALLRDARLSFGARGLFAFIWDLPRNWGAWQQAKFAIQRHIVTRFVSEFLVMGLTRQIKKHWRPMTRLPNCEVREFLLYWRKCSLQTMASEVTRPFVIQRLLGAWGCVRRLMCRMQFRQVRRKTHGFI